MPPSKPSVSVSHPRHRRHRRALQIRPSYQNRQSREPSQFAGSEHLHTVRAHGAVSPGNLVKADLPDNRQPGRSKRLRSPETLGRTYFSNPSYVWSVFGSHLKPKKTAGCLSPHTQFPLGAYNTGHCEVTKAHMTPIVQNNRKLQLRGSQCLPNQHLLLIC